MSILDTLTPGICTRYSHLVSVLGTLTLAVNPDWQPEVLNAIVLDILDGKSLNLMLDSDAVLVFLADIVAAVTAGGDAALHSQHLWVEHLVLVVACLHQFVRHRHLQQPRFACHLLQLLNLTIKGFLLKRVTC